MRVAHQLLSGEVAGGQQVALWLARGARERGHEPIFLSPSAGPFLELVEREGFRAVIVPLGGAGRTDGAARLARTLRRERVDVLHTHAHFSVNVLARLAGRLARVPVVAHMHTANVFRAGPARLAQAAVDDATARLCTRILVVSDATRRALERQGYPRRRMETLHTGIALGPPLPRSPRLRRELGVPDGAPLVVSVGRLSPTKGHRDLVAALARLDGVWAVIVGEDVETGGTFRRELEAAAGERVVLTGARDDVPALLAEGDVLALPSWVEGLPLVVLEAMAQRTAVVASSVGGIPELVVDGETGILVPPRDVDALAAGLASALQRSDELGEAGRRRVERHFPLERMLDRVLEVYEQAAR